MTNSLGCYLSASFGVVRRVWWIALLLLLCLLALPVHGDTITVTNTNDSGAGSLRQALADANDGTQLPSQSLAPLA